MSELNLLRSAHRVTGSFVDQISDWDASTPCSELTARDLVGHLQGGDAQITGQLQDRPVERSVGSAPSAEGYRSAADDLVTALGEPGAPQKMITAPIGRVPAGQMMVMRTIEHVVHGWDLAVSQDLPVRDLNEPAIPLIPITEHLLVQLADVVMDRRPFADPVPVPADAPAIDRLVGLLGRDPRRASGRQD